MTVSQALGRARNAFAATAGGFPRSRIMTRGLHSTKVESSHVYAVADQLAQLSLGVSPGSVVRGSGCRTVDRGSWQLVKFEGGDGSVLTPDDRTKYTLAFDAKRGVAVRVDCNRGQVTWKSSGANQLQLGPLALTRAMCPPGSLHDRS